MRPIWIKWARYFVQRASALRLPGLVEDFETPNADETLTTCDTKTLPIPDATYYVDRLG